MLRTAIPLLLVMTSACNTPVLVATPEETDGGQQQQQQAVDAGSDAGVDAGTPDAGHGPPYPIVLAHGFFGFDSFAGLDFLTYFFEVKDTLAAEGELEVFTPTVDPFNDSATRSAQLERQVQAILASTGAAKVNLIAHSQGGLDARLLASRHPEWIAAVITVSTPHRGTSVSDLISGGLSDPKARAAVDAIVDLAAPSIWPDATRQSSITTALAQFETTRMADFNARVLDQPGVRYFSVAGRSALRRMPETCETSNAARPTFIKDFDDTVDPLSPTLNATEFIISPNVLDPVGNDGLVPVSSAKWGTFLGCVPADHLDEVGQIGGLGPGLGNDWRHKPFYVSLVRFLRAQGY